jgi:hypothetical protein
VLYFGLEAWALLEPSVYISGELVQNFGLSWGGATTLRGVFSSNVSHTILGWDLGCQVTKKISPDFYCLG